MRDIKQEELVLLTARELHVLNRLGRGFMIKEIASELYISRKTVECYVVKLREKLHIGSLHDLTVTAVRWYCKAQQ